jgi:hypothetical protein
MKAQIHRHKPKFIIDKTVNRGAAMHPLFTEPKCILKRVSGKNLIFQK